MNYLVRPGTPGTVQAETVVLACGADSAWTPSLDVSRKHLLIQQCGSHLHIFACISTLQLTSLTTSILARRVAEAMESPKTCDNDISASIVFLQLGLLDHPPQQCAFSQLIFKFIQDEARKVGKKPYRFSEDDTGTLAAGFLEEYEQRLWPSELDNPGRKHLNDPDIADLPPNHGNSGHVRYTNQGRYQMTQARGNEWAVEFVEEVTQNDVRGLSQLAVRLQGFMMFIKEEDYLQTLLSQEQLLKQVLEGQEFIGVATVAVEVPASPEAEETSPVRRDSFAEELVSDEMEWVEQLVVGCGRPLLEEEQEFLDAR